MKVVTPYMDFNFMSCLQESQRTNKTSSGKGEGGSAADYQEGASHVLSVIHDILAQHRGLEAKWHAKKIKLHQRLALRLFQEDVKQVQYLLILVKHQSGNKLNLITTKCADSSMVKGILK